MSDTLVCIDDQEALIAILAKHERVVVKSLDAAHGEGITVDVQTMPEAVTAIKRAKAYGRGVIVQQQIAGKGYQELLTFYA